MVRMIVPRSDFRHRAAPVWWRRLLKMNGDGAVKVHCRGAAARSCYCYCCCCYCCDAAIAAGMLLRLNDGV